jgi:hypothetical protein
VRTTRHRAEAFGLAEPALLSARQALKPGVTLDGSVPPSLE